MRRYHKRLVAWAASLVLILAVLAVPVQTPGAGEPENTYEDMLQGIISYEYEHAGVSSAQEYLDCLTTQAGTSPADWIVVNLIRSQEICSGEKLETEAYLNALAQVTSTKQLTATDWERIAHVYAACGEEKEWIGRVIDSSFYGRGIMSEIYGLFLREQGDYECSLTIEEMVTSLLELQQTSGAWGLNQQIPDIDITAMAIRALGQSIGISRSSLSEDTMLRLTSSIERALNYLSAQQCDSGAYASYGAENAESSAQVLMALLTMKISPEDERFVKNGHTLLHAIRSFETENGGYAHIAGGCVNDLATLQVWDAVLIALNEKGTVDATEKNPSLLEILRGEYSMRQAVSNMFANVSGMQLRLYMALAVVLVLLFACIWMILTDTAILRRPWKLLAVFGIAAVLLVLIFTLRIETPSEYRDRVAAQEGTVTTTITIRGPEGTILATNEMIVCEGDTVFDQLEKATAIHRISMNYTGSTLFRNIYIRSIDRYAEFDYGHTSGWMYRVNGEVPTISCSAYRLREQDEVVWYYSLGEEEVTP